MTNGDTIPIQILAINDFANCLYAPVAGFENILDDDGNTVVAGGGVYMAARLRELRRGHTNSITVATGDLPGGPGLLDYMFRDEPTLEFMGLIDLAISSPGSHEFDEGTEELNRLQHGGASEGPSPKGPWPGAAFQYIAADVVHADTGELLLPAATIREFDGIRIGFVGLSQFSLPSFIGGFEGIADVKFVDDQLGCANAAIRELREQGVNTIVLLMHMGDFTLPGARPNGSEVSTELIGVEGGGLSLAQKVSGADVVVGGHTVAAYVCNLTGPDGEPRLYTNNVGLGRMITEITFDVDRRTGGVVPSSMQGRNHIVTRDIAPDPEIERFLAEWERLLEPLAASPVGEITAEITNEQTASGESQMGNLVADAILSACRPEDQGGAEIAFIYPPAPGVPFLPAGLPYRSDGEAGPGVVTYLDAYLAQPMNFENWVVSLTGAQLVRLLNEQWQAISEGAPEAAFYGDDKTREIILQPSSNVRYAIDRSRPVGERIGDLTIDGEPVDADRVFRVAAPFPLTLVRIGFTVLNEGTDRVEGTRSVPTLIEYLRQNSPVSPPATDRITIRT